jgi:hypothetical protein
MRGDAPAILPAFANVVKRTCMLAAKHISLAAQHHFFSQMPIDSGNLASKIPKKY